MHAHKLVMIIIRFLDMNSIDLYILSYAYDAFIRVAYGFQPYGFPAALFHTRSPLLLKYHIYVISFVCIRLMY